MSTRGHPPPEADHFLKTTALAGVFGGLLAPLVSVPGIYNTTVFSKMVAFQVLVDVTFPAFLVLAWRHRALRPRLAGPVGGLLALLAVLGIATGLAEDPARGFWGTPARMTGMYSLLHVAAWAVMTSSLLQAWPQWVKLLRLQLAVGGVVALVGLVQVGLPSFAMVDAVADDRVSSVMGNPIFLASYLVFPMFLAAWLRGASGHPRLTAVVGVACALCILATGSRGPVLGCMAGVTTALLMTAHQRGSRRLVVGTSVLIASAALAYLAIALGAAAPAWAPFFQAHPALAHLFLLGDAGRLRMWEVTWAAIKSRPLLGWGVENIDVAYTWSYWPVSPCTPMFADRPHNVVLEVLVTGGVVALAAWGAWWTLMFRAARQVSANQPPHTPALLCGLLVAHLVGTLVAFDTPVTWMMLALVCALLQSMRRPMRVVDESARHKHAAAPGLIAFAGLGSLGALAAVMFSLRPWIGALLLHQAGEPAALADPPRAVAAYITSAEIVEPYLDDWLVAVTTHATLVAPSGKTPDDLGGSTARMLVDIARPVAARVLAKPGTRVQAATNYGRMLATVGEAVQDTAMVRQAGVILEANTRTNPRLQTWLLDHADWLALTGHVDDAWSAYQSALKLDPDNAMTNWRAGSFVANAFQDGGRAARLWTHAMECPCAFVPDAAQREQLARAHALLEGQPPPEDGFPAGARGGTGARRDDATGSTNLPPTRTP